MYYKWLSFEANVLHLSSRADGINDVKWKKNNSLYWLCTIFYQTHWNWIHHLCLFVRVIAFPKHLFFRGICFPCKVSNLNTYTFQTKLWGSCYIFLKGRFAFFSTSVFAKLKTRFFEWVTLTIFSLLLCHLREIIPRAPCALWGFVKSGKPEMSLASYIMG